MSLVRIGRLGRAHGVHGEIALEGSSLEPEELESVGPLTWRGRGGVSRTLELESIRRAHTRLLVRFAHVADREQAAELSGGELLVDSDRLPDPGPNFAYTYQLIGLRVETMEGRVLGVLDDIIPSGAHPVYVVRGERELLVPAAPHVLKQVDLEHGVIRVELPAGLEELE